MITLNILVNIMLVLVSMYKKICFNKNLIYELVMSVRLRKVVKNYQLIKL